MGLCPVQRYVPMTSLSQGLSEAGLTLQQEECEQSYGKIL